MAVAETCARIGRRLRAHALEITAALLVLVAARAGGLGQALPWWVLPALVLVAVTISATVYTWWDGAIRGLPLHVRTISQVGALAVAAYASGAGPALVAPLLLLGLTDTVRHAGSRSQPAAVGWGLATMLGGQVLITLGLAPSLLPIATAHAVAGLSAVLLVLVGARVGRLAATSERAHRDALHESARTRALLTHASDMTLVISDATVTYQSPSAERLLGYTSQEVVGRRYLELVHPDDRPEVIAFVEQLIRAPQATGLVTCRLRARDGTWVPVESSCRNLLDDPTIEGVVVNSRDVSERHELERALEHRAFHDDLTGLANRTLLLDRLGHATSRARRAGGHVAVLYVDLDGFKPINDTYGHATGDAVLTTAGRRLAETVRDADTVARLGGDEFAVVAECPDGPDDAARLADRLLATLRPPIEVGGRQVRITASIGIALADPDADEDPVDVLRNADIAMYRAKRAGHGHYAIFERAMHTAVADRLQLETELDRAIERGEFTVHYQPIVQLHDGHIIAVEALARWQHPQRGLIGPGEFIAVAEQTGQIAAIGTLILEEACRQLAAWCRQLRGLDRLGVTVNISMHQLLDAELPEQVSAALDRAGLPADRLTLELTESALAHDARRAREVLGRLKAIGVRLALDDFGTGYSSLAYLHDFPVDVLKIDRSFVSAATADTTSRGALARSMVELGRSLNLVTVAEGIEQADELAHFVDLGCPLGQGYLFARPADAEVTGGRLTAALTEVAAASGPGLRAPLPADG